MVRLFHIIIINTLNIKKASLNMNFLGKIKVKPTGNINIGNDIAYADVNSFEKIGLVTEGLSRQYADCLYKIPKECYGIKYSRFSISRENKS